MFLVSDIIILVLYANIVIVSSSESSHDSGIDDDYDHNLMRNVSIYQFPALREFVQMGKPVWGTCAGLIFLADKATGGLFLSKVLSCGRQSQL